MVYGPKKKDRIFSRVTIACKHELPIYREKGRTLNHKYITAIRTLALALKFHGPLVKLSCKRIPQRHIMEKGSNPAFLQEQEMHPTF